MVKVKVAIVKVENADVDSAVRKAVDLLGGMAYFITGNKNILLKPNMLSAPKDDSLKAKIRTDPRILETLCDMLLELDKEILIGDTSGSGQITREVLERSGFIEIGKKSDKIVVRTLEQNGPIVTEINGKKLKSASISKDFLDADAVINVPKMKTHGLTRYTGAIKNLFGTICGADKTRIHSLGATLNGFSQCLVDLYAFEKSKIKLNVMDAIIALEGMGPGASGTPVEMNLILASKDAVALDAVAFRLMGHNPKRVPTIRFAAEQGLGTMDLEQIEIVGEKIEQHKKRFKLPATAVMGFLPFARFSNVIFRVPKYYSGCTGCGNCVRACPENVIKLVKNREGKNHPIINYKGCISCFTCIEICPEACYKTKNKNLKAILIAVFSFLAIVAIITTLLILFL